MTLAETLRAIKDQIVAIDGDLAKLEEVQETKKAAEEALAEAKKALDATLRENDDTRAMFTRELVKLNDDLDIAKNYAAVELKRIKDLTESARQEHKALLAQINTDRQTHDGILASLESLKKRFG